MKAILRIIEAQDFNIGHARAIKHAIEKAGFQVEIQPTEIQPVQYQITKEVTNGRKTNKRGNRNTEYR